MWRKASLSTVYITWGKRTFTDGYVEEGVYVDSELGIGWLHGPGKVTHADGGTIEGTFVNGYIDEGMANNVKCDDGDTYTGRFVNGLPTGLRTSW